MERHVKERLIGAAVLMAAAVIVVPEMLSGPPEPQRAEAPRAAGETPVKTYTIDLSAPSAQTSGQDVPDTRAPPSEMPAPEGDDEPGGESADASPQADPESTSMDAAAPAPAPATPEQEVKPAAPLPVTPASAPEAKRQVAALPASEPAPKATIASGQTAPKSQAGWAVQLGSFSSKATADRLSAEWRGDGYDAFVMPVKTNGATLYRVRIGPMPTREQADATLRKVKGKVPGAAVVAHR